MSVIDVSLHLCQISSENKTVNCYTDDITSQDDIRACLLNLGKYAVLGGIGIGIFLLIVVLFLLCCICHLFCRIRKLNQECSKLKKKEERLYSISIRGDTCEAAKNSMTGCIIEGVAKDVKGGVRGSTVGSVGCVVGGVANVAGVGGVPGFTTASGGKDKDSRKANQIVSKRREVCGYETIDEDMFDAMVKARDTPSDNDDLQEKHPLDVKVEIGNEELTTISKPNSPLCSPISSPPTLLADLGDYSTIEDVLAVGDNKHQLPTRNADFSTNTAAAGKMLTSESDLPGAESASSSVLSTSPDQEPAQQQQLPIYSVINKQRNETSQGALGGSDLADYCTVGDVFLPTAVAAAVAATATAAATAAAAEVLNQECAAPPPLPPHTAEMSVFSSEEGGTTEREVAGTGNHGNPDAPPTLITAYESET